MDDAAFKVCPFCKEQIRKEAIKCRYCGEWLDQPRSADAKPPQSHSAGSEVARSPTPPVKLTDVPPVVATPKPDANTGQRLQLSPVETLNLISTAIVIIAFLVMLVLIKDVKAPSGATPHIYDFILRLGAAAALCGWIIRGWCGKGKGYGRLACSVVFSAGVIIFAVKVHSSANESKHSQELVRGVQEFSTGIVNFAQQGSTGDFPRMKLTGNRTQDEVPNLINELMSDLASVIEGMDRELDLLEMRPVFESALLTNKAALQIEIQKRLESCRIIEQRRKDFPGAMDAMQQKWAARNISERARPFVAGATNALQDSKSRYDGFFQVRGAEEKAALDYLQFMLGAFGEYEISDTAIYFKNTTNSARYAELTKRIHGIIDEERKLQERYLKFTTEAATRMGKTLNQSVGN